MVSDLVLDVLGHIRCYMKHAFDQLAMFDAAAQFLVCRKIHTIEQELKKCLELSVKGGKKFLQGKCVNRAQVTKSARRSESQAWILACGGHILPFP